MSAEQRLQGVLLELSCRIGNQHIGSGLGGNPKQYLALVSLNTSFVANQSTLFVLDNNSLFIDRKIFDSLPLKDLRKELNNFFTEEVLAKSLPIPELASYLEGNNVDDSVLNLNLINTDSIPPVQVEILKAISLAIKFRNLVIEQVPADAPDTFQVSAELKQLADEIQKFPNSIILLSIRRCLGIDTIVRHNLDTFFQSLFELPHKASENIK